MTDQLCVYGTIGLMGSTFACHALRRRLDPFAPLWLFMVGFAQIYVVQAISYREWALRVRGIDLVTAANFRALWALACFLLLYHLPVGRLLARLLPGPPQSWSAGTVGALSPVLIAWGLICAGILLRGGAISDTEREGMTDGEVLFRSFPAVMLVGAILLVITGRQPDRPRLPFLAAGLVAALMYSLIWMFNGKRSHSLLGILTTLCAYYIPRGKRPPWPVLGTAAFIGALVVALAIGWRGTTRYEHTAAGFVQYLGDFRPDSILESLNVKDRDHVEINTYETEEYGGFLLMMDTVPEKAEFDYGAPYIRVATTFIPRMLWRDKPLPGREKWVNAWIAGSELPRDQTFTGPSIGVLGAAQLNGGAWGTLIVMGLLALLVRTAYEFYRLHAASPWAQAFWALTYYNAWFMTVADDPLNWFYYNWGFTAFPPLAVLWLANRLHASPTAAAPRPVPQLT
jgi:hypothetical protein